MNCRESRAEKWRAEEIEKMRLRKGREILIIVRRADRRKAGEELVDNKKSKYRRILFTNFSSNFNILNFSI